MEAERDVESTRDAALAQAGWLKSPTVDRTFCEIDKLGVGAAIQQSCTNDLPGLVDYHSKFDLQFSRERTGRSSRDSRLDLNDRGCRNETRCVS